MPGTVSSSTPPGFRQRWRLAIVARVPHTTESDCVQITQSKVSAGTSSGDVRSAMIVALVFCSRGRASIRSTPPRCPGSPPNSREQVSSPISSTRPRMSPGPESPALA
jgi:hypothetical protein